MKGSQHIVMHPVSSENLKEIGYDSKTRTLYIVFKKSPSTYAFAKVPKFMYDYMRRTNSSVGHYFHTKIKNRFEMTKD